MLKEQKEILPVCEATNVECPLAQPPYLCSTLRRWQKMGEAARETHEVRRFPHGECSLIRRKPEDSQKK